MLAADDSSVLGDFGNTQFNDGAKTTTFFRKDRKFMVRTDGTDGRLHDYQVKYTFGVSPLQQYLIQLPGGRLQAFGLAWDSRTRAAGGQRWFALYPTAKLGNPLHWTAIDQNWNSMCADCHSTNVRKNYNEATRTYRTTYSEVNIGCEACHGPGADHVAWAGLPRDRRARDAGKGLSVTLNDRNAVSWHTDAVTGEVKRSKPLLESREVELCARCHSRRGQHREQSVHGQPLGDDYRVALLDQDPYFADGQIKGEVYEYGSFVQSRMFHEGVTCSDCHDPHKGTLRAPANQLCTGCHLRDRYDSPRHHFHPLRTAGAQCVECHMPTRTYMTVDPRHDHSIRIPRPDLSVSLGTPNACNNCHLDKTPRWAADAIARRSGMKHSGFQQFGAALHAARLGAPESRRLLIELASDDKQPAIARATALETLAASGDSSLALLQTSSNDRSDLVRRAAADLISNVRPETAGAPMLRLLQDPVRGVRIEAGESLAGVNSSALPKPLLTAFDQASAEFVDAQQLNADRPEAHLNLANYFRKNGRIERAETELRTSISTDPSFSPASINLADLYREMGRDDDAEIVLREAMQRNSDDPSIPYALGLVKIRQNKRADALELFAAAARMDQTDPNYTYVYAIALNDAGAQDAAIATLEEFVELNPYHRESLAALVSFCEHAGDHAKARKYARLLAQLDARE